MKIQRSCEIGKIVRDITWTVNERENECNEIGNVDRSNAIFSILRMQDEARRRVITPRWIFLFRTRVSASFYVTCSFSWKGVSNGFLISRAFVTQDIVITLHIGYTRSIDRQLLTYCASHHGMITAARQHNGFARSFVFLQSGIEKLASITFFL